MRFFILFALTLTAACSTLTPYREWHAQPAHEDEPEQPAQPEQPDDDTGALDTGDV